MRVNIIVFGILKDFFSSGVELEINESDTILQVINQLRDFKKESADVLSRCRFAVHENFIDKDYLLKNGETIFIIPPSSGG
ncbi:MAG: MoaD/ThiS family protein [Cytophagaceae bacterium]|nr:MoaD/ThiS family protein [Cytophagaceae bacterium]